jgi:hypothetical protein
MNGKDGSIAGGSIHSSIAEINQEIRAAGGDTGGLINNTAEETEGGVTLSAVGIIHEAASVDESDNPIDHK